MRSHAFPADKIVSSETCKQAPQTEEAFDSDLSSDVQLFGREMSTSFIPYQAADAAGSPRSWLYLPYYLRYAKKIAPARDRRDWIK